MRNIKYFSLSQLERICELSSNLHRNIHFPRMFLNFWISEQFLSCSFTLSLEPWQWSLWRKRTELMLYQTLHSGEFCQFWLRYHTFWFVSVSFCLVLKDAHGYIFFLSFVCKLYFFLLEARNVRLSFPYGRFLFNTKI